MPKFNVKQMIRPCCEGFEPYIAGKPVETIKRELGLKKVFKLASNENPLGPSPKAVAAMKKAISQVYFYPDSNSWCLRQALAARFKVDAENVILGAGSDEIIELIAKVFFKPTDDVIMSEHAFIRYKLAGKLMGSRVVAVPMKGFTHDLPAIAKAVTPRTKAVFIVNPNNPTGTYNTDVEFRKFLALLLRKCAGKMPLVVVDEAYYEYARVEKDYPETLDYLSQYPNLILLRTFSKIYALAGLRVGYGFAAPAVVDYIERIRPPFNMNSMAQVAAVASLDDKEQVKKGLALVKEGKCYLYAELKRRGIGFVPSAANFVLIDTSPYPGQEAFKKLLKKGVIVRAMDEYNYPYHIRVTTGRPAENRLFIKELVKLLAGK